MCVHVTVHSFRFSCLRSDAHRAIKTRREGNLKNVHYSRCQLFIGDFEFPPKGKDTGPRTLPYDQRRFFLSDSMTLATFQRLRHARWHLKTTLATDGCALRVGPLRGRDDTETSEHCGHLGPHQNSVAKATRRPQI